MQLATPDVRLPQFAMPLIGRQSEIARLEELLGHDDCRLLTLTGPGGIGKTRLALEVAKQQHGDYLDGYHFVPLQPLNSPEFILSAIAESLPFHFSCSGNLFEQVFEYLSEKSLLLVMDNFEHLLEGVQLLSDILDHAPSVKIMTTSRERLNLVQEWVYEVGGLSFPADESKDEIERYGAIQLFMHNARRVHAGLKLTEAQKPAVSRICRLVEGMPLAIELASAWARALPCTVIADEIQRSLDILETSARNVAPRHQNMRAVFEPTWDRLTERERDVFQKLSTFRGSFTLEAAEAVAGATRPTLLTLVDKSLLRVDENARYSLHELLRQYGEEQLTLSPQTREHTLDLHRAYYMEILANCQDQIVFLGKQKEGVTTIGNELENIRPAWQRAVEQGQLEEMVAGGEGLWGFY